MKPWSLVRDGDLWRIFWLLLLQKNPDAVALSKVKGHATAADVAAGKISLADLLGNDRADTMAHQGVRANISGLVQLSSLLNKHEGAYKELVIIVHQHLLDRHNAIIAEVRRSDIATGLAPLHGAHKPILNPNLFFPEEGTGGQLQFIWTPLMSRSCKVMLVFSSSFSWVPVDGPTRQGITWIELLILFELSGGNIC